MATTIFSYNARACILVQDGSLKKNDQVVLVNGQALLGHSNQEAMDILRSAMTSREAVELVVARRTTPNVPSMAALGEEPEEVCCCVVSGCGLCVGHTLGMHKVILSTSSTSSRCYVSLCHKICSISLTHSVRVTAESTGTCRSLWSPPPSQ